MAGPFGRHHQHLAGFKHGKRFAQGSTVDFVAPHGNYIPEARKYPPTGNIGYVVSGQWNNVSGQRAQHHDRIDKCYMVEYDDRRAGRGQIVGVFSAAEPGYEPIANLVDQPPENLAPALEVFVIVDQARIRCPEFQAGC